MSIVNKPDMNYGVWADGGNIEIPSSEKVEQGWIIEKPLNETMNWLQNRQDRMLQYINQRGIPEWDIRTEYPELAYVARVGNVYQAISPNTDSDPTLNSEIWELAFVSNSDFIDYSERVDSIENTEGYLGLYVSKALPIMTGEAKGVAYKDPTGASGFGFDTTIPKVTNNGETVVEFSGGTNPKDVVTHEQLALAIQNYKVGDIYITTASGDPSDRLGYGTWEGFGEGRTLVGFSSSTSNSIPEWVKIINSQFGEFEHTLTVEEMAKHAHDIILGGANATSPSSSGGAAHTPTAGNSRSVGLTSEEGGGKAHNNVQPSIVVYFWKRTA